MPPGDEGSRVLSRKGSDGEAQCTAAVPSAVPGEDGGAVPKGMPSGDTQSLAHRSGGDAQDAAPASAEAPVNDIPPDIRKRPAVASGPLAAPQSKRPGYVAFPKCKYHPDYEAVVVDNAEEEAKLGEGWQDLPL